MLRLDLLEEDGRNSLISVPLHKLQNKEILITGASGLLGTCFLYGLNYCQKELGMNMHITAIIKNDIPEHLKSMTEDVEFVIGDLSKPEFLKYFPEFDIIIHAATYGQPGKFLSSALDTITLNTTVTHELLKILNPNGKFLFLSSSEVYNGLSNPPFSENQIGTSNTDHTRSSYIESKRCGEAICNAYRNLGVDAKSVRLMLAYGPGTKKDDARVLNQFIQRALQTGENNLQDSGSAERAYIYISDAVNMMWNILLNGSHNVYNVGGEHLTTIYELATLIASYIPSKVLLPEKLDVYKYWDCYVNMSRYEKEFGKMFKIPLSHGIQRTIDWQKDLYS